VVSTRSRTARLRLHGPRFRGRDQTAIRRAVGARECLLVPPQRSLPPPWQQSFAVARGALWGCLPTSCAYCGRSSKESPSRNGPIRRSRLPTRYMSWRRKGEFEVESGVRRESRSRATHEPRPYVELLVRADFDETFAHGPQRCLRARGEAKLAQDVETWVRAVGSLICSPAALLLSPAPSRRRISSSRVVRAASDQSPDPARRDDVRLGARVWRVLWEK
jgi:hypothetical protein